MKKVSVIIVAGGSGRRMGSSVPKQFLTLNSGICSDKPATGAGESAATRSDALRFRKTDTRNETEPSSSCRTFEDSSSAAGATILEITIRRFLTALPECDMVVVLPADEIPRWEEICAVRGLKGTHRICIGGDTRFASVSNGIMALGACDYIAVHDGVRPLVTGELIHRCIDTAERYGSAIPAVRPTDSFRISETEGESRPIDRNLLRAVQTPQIFRADILRKAYRTAYDPAFTDDASVAEAAGESVMLCEGDRENIKITTPEDLAVARVLLSLQLRRGADEEDGLPEPAPII